MNTISGMCTFGIHNKTDFQAKNISYTEQGASFDVEWTKSGELPILEHYTTNLFGEMNVYNSRVWAIRHF